MVAIAKTVVSALGFLNARLVGTRFSKFANELGKVGFALMNPLHGNAPFNHSNPGKPNNLTSPVSCNRPGCFVDTENGGKCVCPDARETSVLITVPIDVATGVSDEL